MSIFETKRLKANLILIKIPTTFKPISVPPDHLSQWNTSLVLFLELSQSHST